MGKKKPWSFEVTPSAARLTGSLRDIGYDFPVAVADLVDNSIAAGAGRVDVDVEFDGSTSWVSVADDGCGMTANGLLEALRYGARGSYGSESLGRYGLGLKTAPLSQCRRITVVTRRSTQNCVITRRTLDLDIVEEWDAWLVVEEEASPPVMRAMDRLRQGPGTVVVWEKLDRVLPESRPDGGWARRRLGALVGKTSQHLGMVFHRFLEDDQKVAPLVLTVNGEKVEPWNPFAPDESETYVLPVQDFEIVSESGAGVVRLSPYVLPPRDSFSSPAEFERLSGPLKWNRQQGLYVYRANRLVQWGGWNGIRAIDEHTKLARAALDFSTDLDEVFHINVAKMRVTLPSELRQMVDRPLHELCMRANQAYRNASPRTDRPQGESPARGSVVPSAGLALRAAAMELGHTRALTEITDLLKKRDPDVVAALGLN